MRLSDISTYGSWTVVQMDCACCEHHRLTMFEIWAVLWLERLNDTLEILS